MTQLILQDGHASTTFSSPKQQHNNPSSKLKIPSLSAFQMNKPKIWNLKSNHIKIGALSVKLNLKEKGKDRVDVVEVQKVRTA